MGGADLHHSYRFGDLYEALEACQLLESSLAAPHRQRPIDDQIWRHRKHLLGERRGEFGASIEEFGSTGFHAMREEQLA
jgi:hypothetical protein